MTGVQVRCGVPGLALPGRPMAPRPAQLLAPGPVLLAGAEPGSRMTRAEHVRRWGELPRPGAAELAAGAASVDLRGGGGAAFPTARKIDSMSGRTRLVVVNGAEGEPTSGKDAVLLSQVPHLVLDGAELVASALGARRIVVRLAEDQPLVAAAVESAVAERPASPEIRVSLGPAAFVAGEATAVLSALAGGPALPRQLGRPPALPRRFGRRGRPVFLSNVETFARLAAITRGERRPSSLVTASGAVSAPGVLELQSTQPVADLADLVGLVGQPRILVTGGWHGAWTEWPAVAPARLTRDGVAAAGGRWGVGSFTWLPDDVSGHEVLVAMAQVLARESAQQCGPCHRGLPVIAAGLAGSGAGPDELAELLDEVSGGGICSHPSASAAAIRSALAVLGRLG